MRRLRGMGSIYRRGRVWWISYSHRGRVFKESSHSDNERVAERLLKKRIGETSSNRFVGPSEEKVTFDQLADLLAKDYKLRGLRSGGTVGVRLKHLRAYFGLDRALDINALRMRAYQQHRLDQGAKAGTVNRELHGALGRAFRLAVKLGVLSVAPVMRS